MTPEKRTTKDDSPQGDLDALRRELVAISEEAETREELLGATGELLQAACA